MTRYGGSELIALQRLGRYPLYISTPIAAIIAAVITGIAHLIIGDVLGGIPEGFQVDTPSGKQDLLFSSSIVATFMYALVGGVIYAIVRRFSSNPERTFVIIAGIVTLLSLLQPFLIEDGPGSVIVTLVTLHIIAGIVATVALIALTRPKW